MLFETSESGFEIMYGTEMWESEDEAEVLEIRGGTETLRLEGEVEIQELMAVAEMTEMWQ